MAFQKLCQSDGLDSQLLTKQSFDLVYNGNKLSEVLNCLPRHNKVMSNDLELIEVSFRHGNIYWLQCSFLMKVYSYAEKIITFFQVLNQTIFWFFQPFADSHIELWVILNILLLQIWIQTNMDGLFIFLAFLPSAFCSFQAQTLLGMQYAPLNIWNCIVSGDIWL